jgi:hypothetical protein
MDSDERPVALVTGGSAGLGLSIAEKLLGQGYRVMIVGRDAGRLKHACNRLSAGAEENVVSHRCDLTSVKDVSGLFAAVQERFGRLDALINCVGTSDRGLIENLPPERLEILLHQNVLTALLCSQAAVPLLELSRGAIVNIGSLASKVGSRYIGGYAIAKHAVAGMTQQMRLELKPRGIHVGLVSPGPIRREDAGLRYQESIDRSVPEQASAPGGGTRLKGLAPQRVADAVVRCLKHRAPDIIVPGYLRFLIAIGHALPRLGDWLLLKFTSTKSA